uniref:Uncharacterized protein n=1 Tax=Amphimedon queenslandica TaxID=400682 RepID=A0A1X7VFU7_AMPQE
MDHPIYVHFVRLLQHKICVERIWPHINSRVNYPIKRILLWMEQHEHIDMTCEVTKFCVLRHNLCISCWCEQICCCMKFSLYI